MKLPIRAAALCCLVITTGWAAPAPDAFTEDTSVTHITISPSGERVAYRIDRDGDDAVYVVDVRSGKALFSAQFGDAQVRGLSFTSEQQVLMIQHVPHFDAEYGDNGFLWLKMIDLDAGRVIDAGSRSSKAEFYAHGASWPPVGVTADRDEVYVAGRDPDTPYIDETLFKMSLEQGLAPRVAVAGTKATVDWFFIQSQDALVREEYEHDRDEYLVTVIGEDGERVLIERQGPVRSLDVLGLTRDEQSLVYRSLPPGAEHESLFTMRLDDGSASGPIAGGPSILMLRDTNHRVYGLASGEFPQRSYQLLDESLAARFDAVRRSFPDARVEFEAASDDLEHFVVRVSEDWSKAYYLMYSTGIPKPAVVAKEEKRLGKDDVGEQRVHSYAMPDGSMVRALVTARPATLAAGKAPAIVLGNWGWNTLSGGDYDWVAQYFASLGYVVVQPETRYARYTGAFSFTDRPGWATDAIGDADFVMSQLIAQQLVDADRMCVIGFGFGGYAALTSGYESGHDYRCIASHRGYVDVLAAVRRMRDRFQYDDPQMVAMQRRYGFASFDADDVRTHSPLEHAAEYEAPVLLLYSSYDARSFESRAKEMVKALEKEGNEVTLVKLKSKDVRFLKTGGREPALRALADFVSKHNPATK